MELFFLEADKPITKRYGRHSDGSLYKHPYPFVYNVTSHRAPCPDIATFEQLVFGHSVKGHTLVKGGLERPLIKESRAGSTNPDAKTAWICLDLDGVEQFQSVDLFLAAIGCADVDYVLQWSSSMSVENNSGFRCHIFMLLDTPQTPQILKHWLMNLNLTVPQIRAQIDLTKTYNALRWPLDVTTCQNDKLLYVAPPKFDKPMADPFNGTRIFLHTKARRSLALPAVIPTREALRAETHKLVNELRLKHQLPKHRPAKYKFSGATEYLASPDSAVITEQKEERDFVYFNLNGGDSWAYYHPVNNPQFIFNFKGEPAYRTEELLPEYWAQLPAATKNHANNFRADVNGMVYLAFRDFQSAQYYNGTYDTVSDELKLAVAKSEGQIKQFLKQHGQTVGDFIPDWDMVFEPLNNVVVDPDARVLNTYRPSEYFKDVAPKPYPWVPPTIEKVVKHVIGDQEQVDHFYNWLASIVQNMDRTGTAWVWHGTQGTGKGLLFHNIITPLFGEWNTTGKLMEEIEGDFTGFMKNTIVMFVDEVEAGKSLYRSKVTAKLKNLIVEPMISIREMYRPAYMHRNRVNIIFASNKNAPVEVDPDDRRFNVAVRQDVPLSISVKEIDTIATELDGFYRFLKHYPVDAGRARTPLISAARTTLIATNRLAVDVVADALLAGNIEQLWDYLPSRKPLGMEYDPKKQGLYERYRRLMIDVVSNGTTKLSRDDLLDVFEWCVGGMPQSPNKFTSLLKHHRIHMGNVWLGGRTVRGIDVAWVSNPQWLAAAQAEITNNTI